jgi:MoxR-like ATPase
MIEENSFKLYKGDGTTLSERGLHLPLFQTSDELVDPSAYIAGEGLRDSVNVSLTLGQPLLVTGEPGTGKTQLAHSIAYELGLPPPLVFHTKTTSTAKDLFYQYDALHHFHDAQFRKEELDFEDYITYEALGLAILSSIHPDQSNTYLPAHLQNIGPVRSVVLIDEIDKAPRDLPNDILNEIENLSFTVKETGRTFSAAPSYRPILILTSNSEKNLPDAFLRRCVFYHIPFPDEERLKEIVRRRLKLSTHFTQQMLHNAIQHFERIREFSLKKKPATAELLSWIRILEKMQLDVGNLKPGEAEALAFTYSVLAKSKEDNDLILQNFHLA